MPPEPMPLEPFDAVVSGGGVVGAAATLGLLARGARVRWLRCAQPAAPLPEGFAARVYALSPGNLAWLEALGVTRNLDRSRIGSVREMEIRPASGGGLDLSARQAGVAEMALIVESDHLLRALETTIAGLAPKDGGPPGPQIVSLLPACAPGSTMQACDGHSAVHRPLLEARLGDGSDLVSRLLVAADGANSPLRRMAGIEIMARDYGQQAVVANFACDKPHRGIACQWFDRGTVLAWLPLPGNHVSIVWSLPRARAVELLTLDAAAFTARVAAAGHHRWGGLRLVSLPQAFPLRLQRAQRLTAARTLLVGDAAHVVHPLAGQGMNLGLRDVRALLEATDNRRDPGDEHALARYRALRRVDVQSIETVTDGLSRLFSDPLGSLFGGYGMGLLNHLAPLKSELVRQAMR